MAARPDILVIGAGIIGLTSAIALAEAGHRVQVRTAEPPQATTSAAAGALWGPWLVEPRTRVLPWAEHSLAVLQRLAVEPSTGVRIANGTDIARNPHEPSDWTPLRGEVRRCNPGELPQGYPYGTRYTAPLIDMPVHLTYLVRRFEALGGTLEIDPIDDLTVAATDVPIVVNCAGLGARTLVPDESVFPIRGQHLVVTNPGLSDFIEADTGDSSDLVAIYPHGDSVVLGGSAEYGRWDLQPDLSIAAGILDRCVEIEPRLRHADLIDHRVGLRPTRPTVRLDAQRTRGGLIVHNYGHGGAGVTLAWGCAAEVVARCSSLNGE